MVSVKDYRRRCTREVAELVAKVKPEKFALFMNVLPAQRHRAIAITANAKCCKVGTSMCISSTRSIPNLVLHLHFMV